MSRQHVLAALSALIAIGTLSANPLFAIVPTEYQPNYDDGYGLGYPIGYKSGIVTGKERGRTEGSSIGRADGYQTGWDDFYQPAFDRAYDAQYPLGHAEGWNDGVLEGFDEGFDWAATIAVEFLNNWYNGGNYGSGITMMMNGSLDVQFGSFGGADITTLRPGSFDWAAHYFDVGYGEGHSQGFSIGSDEGYNLTYPAAYKAAYKIGYIDGTDEGTYQGTRDGGDEGYDDGWGVGYDKGFDQGFYAGVDYHLFDDFVVPRYDFSYTARTTTYQLSGFNPAAPEPSSILLVGMAVALGLLRRSRRG